ncbi:hypothetical protein PROVALCAL_00436, partial [Providencia alcalifaciens DSM 30120]
SHGALKWKRASLFFGGPIIMKSHCDPSYKKPAKTTILIID